MPRLYGETARGATPAYALRAAKRALIGGGGAYARPFKPAHPSYSLA